MGYDFSQVTERLFIGSQVTSAGDVEALNRAKVTHFIDTTMGNISSLILSGHLAYLCAPTDDNGEIKTVEWFAPAVSFAMEALAKPGPKVICQCAAGVNRSASMAYAILRALGWPSFDALELIHRTRPVTRGGVRYQRDAELALASLGWVR